MTRDDRELHELLRQATDRLDPPDGSWEHIARRASRRKWAKATLAIAAGVIVVAGAVPAVIAVRGSGGGDQGFQTLGTHLTSGPAVNTASPQPAPIASSAPTEPPNSELAGFVPNSLSFIYKTEGYAWGSVGSSHRGTVAYTADDGLNWTRLAASPNIDNAFVTGDGSGDGQIRFAGTDLGFIYGQKLFITQDAGTSWAQMKAPGYVEDLEAMHGRIWALAEPCQHCGMVRLYTATVGDPSLHLVNAVTEMRVVRGTATQPGTASLAVVGSSVNVLVGSAGFWSSPNGKTWTERVDPCQAGPGRSNVTTSLLAAATTSNVLAACGYNPSGGQQDKRTFVTFNSGNAWTRTKAQPSSAGYLQTLATGTRYHAILGTSGAGAQVTYDGGVRWLPAQPQGIDLSFVGFISDNHVVALADRTGTSGGAFATSRDAGKQWTVTRFPK